MSFGFDINNTIWIVLEKDADDTLRGQHLQLLALGQKLCAYYKATLCCAVLGESLNVFAANALKYADFVFTSEHEGYSFFAHESYATLFENLFKEKKPRLLLMADSALSRSLAPLLSYRLHAELITGATSVSFSEEEPVWGKAVCYGAFLERFSCGENFCVITANSGIFKTPPSKGKNGRLLPLNYEAPKPVNTLLSIKSIMKDNDLLPGDSEIVVAGGRGVGGPNGMKLIYELANALGGAVAASRPAVDLGWINRSHQIGQTGITVSPRLYIACGISGALQHISGMQGSDVIVAINRDENANIFRFSDYGICGDLFKVIPEMIKELRA